MPNTSPWSLPLPASGCLSAYLVPHQQPTGVAAHKTKEVIFSINLYGITNFKRSQICVISSAVPLYVFSHFLSSGCMSSYK